MSHPLNDTTYRTVVFASFGNDSIALIQWAIEQHMPNVCVLYHDTGWASDAWRDRVDWMCKWWPLFGVEVHVTQSEGFEALMRRKKRFSRSGMQFCTEELKIRPSMKWLDENDPDKLAVCLVGVRREESIKRKDQAYLIPNAASSGGRITMYPLAAFNEEERDALILRSGIPVLPHKSKECFPCIHASRSDLLMVAEDEIRVRRIELLEWQMSQNGYSNTMFRPGHHMGAHGIREIIKWTRSKRGEYKVSAEKDDDCDSGFCGT